MQQQISSMTEKEFSQQYQKDQVRKLVLKIKEAPDRDTAELAIIDSEIYDHLSESKRKHIDALLDRYHPVKSPVQDILFWAAILGFAITVATFLIGDGILEDLSPEIIDMADRS